MPRTSWNSTAKQFQRELTSCAKGVNKATEQLMNSATQDFLQHVQDRKENLPYYTANLHDSIAAYVSRSGRILRAYYMPQEATVPQHVTKISATSSSDSMSKDIWGYREAINAVRRSRPQAKGIGTALFIAVPYAGAADERSSHPGYLDWLQDNFEISINTAMRLLQFYRGDAQGAKEAFSKYTKFTHFTAPA